MDTAVWESEGTPVHPRQLLCYLKEKINNYSFYELFAGNHDPARGVYKLKAKG